MFEDDKTLLPADKVWAKEMAAQAAERAGNAVKDFFLKEIDLGQLIDDIEVPIYAKHYSESELRDLIAFYRTPTGQKVVKTSPQVILESMVSISEKLLPKLQDFLKKVVDQELAI